MRMMLIAERWGEKLIQDFSCHRDSATTARSWKRTSDGSNNGTNSGVKAEISELSMFRLASRVRSMEMF
jgi:hypothetical protein